MLPMTFSARSIVAASTAPGPPTVTLLRRVFGGLMISSLSFSAIPAPRVSSVPRYVGAIFFGGQE